MIVSPPVATLPVKPIPVPGTAQFGTVRIGHAMNGIHYTEHELVGPMVPPAGVFSGSIADAVAGTRELAAASNAAFALVMAEPGEYHAHLLTLDPTLSYAFRTGSGTGGNFSIEFPTVARRLIGVVTEKGMISGHGPC